jgi:hypothetical protein
MDHANFIARFASTQLSDVLQTPMAERRQSPAQWIGAR